MLQVAHRVISDQASQEQWTLDVENQFKQIAHVVNEPDVAAGRQCHAQYDKTQNKDGIWPWRFESVLISGKMRLGETKIK